MWWVGGVQAEANSAEAPVMSRRVSSSDGATSLSSSRRMPLSKASWDTVALVAPRTISRSPMVSTVTFGPASTRASSAGCGCLGDDGRCLPCGDRLDGVGGQQFAATDHHEVVGEHAEFADEVARHEHGAAAASEVGEVEPQPTDAVGIESVRRLVEQQDLRVSEQGAGEGQALAHAEGEPAGALVGGRLETDLDQHLVHPGRRDRAHGGHGPEVVSSSVAGVHAAGVENGADQAGGVPEVVVADAVVADLAMVGVGEPDHHPHRGRLAGSVRADEAGDAAGGHVERQVVDGGACRRSAW